MHNLEVFIKETAGIPINQEERCMLLLMSMIARSTSDFIEFDPRYQAYVLIGLKLVQKQLGTIKI